LRRRSTAQAPAGARVPRRGGDLDLPRLRGLRAGPRRGMGLRGCMVLEDHRALLPRRGPLDAAADVVQAGGVGAAAGGAQSLPVAMPSRRARKRALAAPAV